MLPLVGATNLPLVRYLIQQGNLSIADRLAVLRIFYPEARTEDWKLKNGGIRVQAIKKTDEEAGIVHYGTEVLTNADRSMAALLGASPGASVCVSIALDVIHQCRPDLLQSDYGRVRLQEMIPAHGEDLRLPAHAQRFTERKQRTRTILHLTS